MDNKDSGKPIVTATRKNDGVKSNAPHETEPEPRHIAPPEPDDDKAADNNNPANLRTGFDAMKARKFNAGAGKDKEDSKDPAEKDREEFTKRQEEFWMADTQRAILRLEHQLARIDRDIAREQQNVLRLRHEEQQLLLQQQKTEVAIETVKQEKEDLNQEQRELNRMADNTKQKAEEAEKELQDKKADPTATEDGSEQYRTADGRIVDEHGVETDFSKRMTAEEKKQLLESPDKGGLKSFEEFEKAKLEADAKRHQEEQLEKTREETKRQIEQKNETETALEKEASENRQKIEHTRHHRAASESSLVALDKERGEVCDKLEEEKRKLKKEKEVSAAVSNDRTSASGVAPSMKQMDGRLEAAFNQASQGTDDIDPTNAKKRTFTPSPSGHSPGM